MARAPARRLILVAAGVVVVAAGAVLVSAATDRPGATVRAHAVIRAEQGPVWAVLTDFASYPRWNPLLVSAEGSLREGARFALGVRAPSGEVRHVEARLVILRPGRKLRWLVRRLVPGIRDEEYEVLVRPGGPEDVDLSAESRVEGVLQPLADMAGLERQQHALLGAVAHEVARRGNTG